MIGKIFKFLFYGIILLVVGLLGFRLYTFNHYPDFAKGVIATDTLRTGYKSGTLAATTWEMPTKIDAAGEFFVYEPLYFENEKTLIITVRYNDSLLEAMKFDGGGDALPLFPSLYADGTERVLPTKYEYGYAYGIYSYRRYVFENTDLDIYEHLYLDIHRNEDYGAVPYTTLEIYSASTNHKEYKLTAHDKKELAK